MPKYIDRAEVESLFSAACAECRDSCEEFDGFYADCNQCLLHGVKEKLATIPAADVRPGQATVPMNERDADGLSLYLRNLAGSNAGLTNYDRDLLRDASKLIDEFHDALKQERRRHLIADPHGGYKHEADPV